jgi:uncharacterized protein (TIGR01777 family)
MRIAITGASGYIGSALAQALETSGNEVQAIRRGPPDGPRTMWDPAAGWIRPGTFEGADAVVHLSGASIGASRWTAGRRSELRSSRVASTALLAERLASLERPPAVLVTASAIGYYGDRGDELLTESSEQGEGFLAELVADWEAATAPAAARGIRTVHVRFAPVLGPGNELLRRLLTPFWIGLGGRLGSGRQWFSWVAIDDLVHAVERMLSDATFGGPVRARAAVRARAHGRGTAGEPARAAARARGRRLPLPLSHGRPRPARRARGAAAGARDGRLDAMSLQRLEARQWVPAALDEAWDFFTDPRNLARLTPPELGFQVTSPLPARIYAGLIVSYRLRPLLRVPTQWVTEITQVVDGTRFVDEQRLGPYRLWHHEHAFRAVDGGTEVRDLVHYALPLGALGDLAHAVLVRRQLRRIFDYRAHALRAIFGDAPRMPAYLDPTLDGARRAGGV